LHAVPVHACNADSIVLYYSQQGTISAYLVYWSRWFVECDWPS
jgi:hypothetical protein